MILLALPILTVLAATGGIKAFSPGYLLSPIRRRINKYKIVYPITECDTCGAGSFYNILTTVLFGILYTNFPWHLLPVLLILNGLVSIGIMTFIHRH